MVLGSSDEIRGTGHSNSRCAMIVPPVAQMRQARCLIGIRTGSTRRSANHRHATRYAQSCSAAWPPCTETGQAPACLFRFSDQRVIRAVVQHCDPCAVAPLIFGLSGPGPKFAHLRFRGIADMAGPDMAGPAAYLSRSRMTRLEHRLVFSVAVAKLGFSPFRTL